jgi:hypothetical protein
MPTVLTLQTVAGAVLGLDAAQRQHQRRWCLVAMDTGADTAPLPSELPHPFNWAGAAGPQRVTTLAEIARLALQLRVLQWLQQLPPLKDSDLSSKPTLDTLLAPAAQKAQDAVRSALTKAEVAADAVQRVAVVWCERGTLLAAGPVMGLADRRKGPLLYQAICHWLWPMAMDRMATKSWHGFPSSAPPAGLLKEDGTSLDGNLIWPEGESPLDLSERGLSTPLSALKQAHRLLTAMANYQSAPDLAIAGEALWALDVDSGSIEQLALASGRLVLHDPHQMRRGIPSYGRAGRWLDGDASVQTGLYEASLDDASDELACQTQAEIAADTLNLNLVASPGTAIVESATIDYARTAAVVVVRAGARILPLAMERLIGRVGPQPMRREKADLDALQREMDGLQRVATSMAAFAVRAAARASGRRPALQTMASLAKRRIDVVASILEKQEGFTELDCLNLGDDMARNWGEPVWTKQDGTKQESKDWPLVGG